MMGGTVLVIVESQLYDNATTANERQESKDPKPVHQGQW
jgi:hypothetical protein